MDVSVDVLVDLGRPTLEGAIPREPREARQSLRVCGVRGSWVPARLSFQELLGLQAMVMWFFDEGIARCSGVVYCIDVK